MRAAAWLLLFAAAPALAFDPFEIQVYDGTRDEPGQAGLEMHLNRDASATRLTFEPSYGVTRSWEMGGYLLTRQGHYEGVKLRSKLAGEFGYYRLGMNFEISLSPGGNWGGEIRPIIAWENANWLLAANPDLSFPAAFEPGAMVKYKFGPVAAGLEYYGTLPAGEHYLFEAIDLLAVEKLELNVGVGEGHAVIAKMILGYVF
jgi:hypothetical protein